MQKIGEWKCRFPGEKQRVVDEWFYGDGVIYRSIDGADPQPQHTLEEMRALLSDVRPTVPIMKKIKAFIDKL